MKKLMIFISVLSIIFSQEPTLLDNTISECPPCEQSCDGHCLSDEIVQGYYSLKELILFTKCTNLCPSIELYLKNNFPIIVKYTVGDLGEIKLALTPKLNISID